MRMFLQEATVSAMLCEMEAQSVEWKTTHCFALIVSPTQGVQGAGRYRAGNTTRQESGYEGGNEFVNDFKLYKPAFFLVYDRLLGLFLGSREGARASLAPTACQMGELIGKQ